MLSFVQSWFTSGAHPVGIDFGTGTLRLAQVENAGSDFRLIAAASATVPADIRNDPSARLAFFTETVRHLWARGNFRGRRAVIGLPSAWLHIHPLRLPPIDEASLKKAIVWESEGKFPFPSADAVLRHAIAGEVAAGSERLSEVIVMAARRDLIEGLLGAAGKARLEVVGMTVEPRALIDCFLNVYRRRSDAAITNCFVDVGHTATRVVIARGSRMYFARSIPIGGSLLDPRAASASGVAPEDAPDRQTARVETPAAISSADVRASGAWQSPRTGHPPATAGPSAQVDQALDRPLSELARELSLCRRYHDTTFPDALTQRLVFVGGQASDRALCLKIAQALNLSSQIGDPLIRMGRTSDVGLESGIDRRLPQPAWAIAVGLSMGTSAAETAVAARGAASAGATGTASDSASIASSGRANSAASAAGSNAASAVESTTPSPAAASAGTGAARLAEPEDLPAPWTDR